MTTFKLFHADPMVSWPFEDYVPKEPGREYRRVAIVWADTMNDVVRFTQNSDTPWTEDTHVVSDKTPRRSTDIGDVIQAEDGRIFVVAPLGFDELTAEQPEPESTRPGPLGASFQGCRSSPRETH